MHVQHGGHHLHKEAHHEDKILSLRCFLFAMSKVLKIHISAGSPAPCRAAGGPAVSWGSWSAAAAPCRGTGRCSSSAADHGPRLPAAGGSSTVSLSSRCGMAGEEGATSSGPRTGPPTPARKGAAPNAWLAKFCLPGRAVSSVPTLGPLSKNPREPNLPEGGRPARAHEV